LCKKDITYSAKDYGWVGRKGLATINEFTLKHSELNKDKPIPIYKFHENRKLYVHVTCRTHHTNTRRYEKLCKRQSIDEDYTSSNLLSDDKQFSFHSDCYICGAYIDKDKARKYPDNKNMNTCTSWFLMLNHREEVC